MITNSVLRLFLMLSIIIILAGITLIVFNQFDRGYVFMGGETDYQIEQSNLIDHVYQTQVKPEASADSPLVMKLNKATVVIQSEADTNKPIQQETPQLKSPGSAPTTPVTPQPVVETPPLPATNNPWQSPAPPANDYYTHLLRNNPWSPHYKPGY